MRFLTAFCSQGNGVRVCLVACVIYCHIYLTRFSKDLHKQIDFRPKLLKVEDKRFIHKNFFLKPSLASKLSRAPGTDSFTSRKQCTPTMGCPRRFYRNSSWKTPLVLSKHGESKGTFNILVSDTSAMPLCLKTTK